MASGYKETADGVDVEVQFLEHGDWRADIFNYLKDSARGGTQKDKTGMSSMSKVRQDSDSASISNESYHQTVAIQRLGHGHDWSDQPVI